jgi:2'-5' RNA ligase
VLWLGISDGLTELRRVRELFHERIGSMTSKRESFHPHLTLARFRDFDNRPGPEPRLALASALGGTVPHAGPCRIDRVTLYESHLSPKGPTYAVLASAALLSCT